MSVRICRAGWNREKALQSNYASNRFQSDPNEGFGRNAAPPKVSKLIPNHSFAEVLQAFGNLPL